MKKTKLLLALAMVIAALSFSFKVHAQSSAPVLLSSTSNRISGWTGSTTWYITLHNENTDEDIYLQTYSYNYREDDGFFHLGSIPAGTYTVTLYYYNYIYDNYFDWIINDQGNYNYHMVSGYDYQIAQHIVVDDSIYSANYGLTIYMYAN